MMGADYDIKPERIAAIEAIRQQFKGDSAATQRDRLLMILREIGPVSTFELSRFGDIYYPPSRKHELVAEGHDITTTRRVIRTESGERHSLGVYALAPGQKAAG